MNDGGRSLTEQMTYNGYLAPRIQVLSGTSIAVALVSFAWSFQHVLLPLSFDRDFMLYRFLASIPNTVFSTVLFLCVRRLLPLHCTADGGMCS